MTLLMMVCQFTTLTDVRLHAQHCCISDGIISTNVEPCDNIGHKRKYLYLIENKQVMILKSLAQAAKRDFLSWDFCHSVGTSVAAALNHIVGRVRRTLWNMEANDAITRQ